MREQTTLWERPVLPSDIVYTPESISKSIIKHLNIGGGGNS